MQISITDLTQKNDIELLNLTEGILFVHETDPQLPFPFPEIISFRLSDYRKALSVIDNSTSAILDKELKREALIRVLDRLGRLIEKINVVKDVAAELSEPEQKAPALSEKVVLKIAEPPVSELNNETQEFYEQPSIEIPSPVKNPSTFDPNLLWMIDLASSGKSSS